jgi:hypothetical protein
MPLKDIRSNRAARIKQAEWTPGSTDAFANQVMQPVLAFFDGLRNRDPESMVAQVLPNIEAMNLRSGKMRRQSVEQLSAGVRSFGNDSIDEPILSAFVRIDENLASVWMEYEFYISGRLDHVGTNVFTLHKLEETWVITTMADNSFPIDMRS